ncbi:histidine-containing phosphotransfer protein 1-like [Apium graveolens]|uniref:histidine-containing phosphotransfer protein 1-like n=1 Tax=Apium graveolens TaxID=4045 RepID=UPI003D794002
MSVEELIGRLRAHEERIRGHVGDNGNQLLLTREELKAYLDDQFKNLQKLQDDLSNPNFVVETVSNFFINFERTVLNITTALHQQLIDWKKVEILIFSLKGSTSSIGAHRLHEACIVLLEHYNQQNVQGCFDSLHNELIAAGGSIPRQ